MKYYILDMKKDRWEIRLVKEGEFYPYNKTKLEDLKSCRVVRWNDNYCVCHDKERLKEFVSKIIKGEIERLEEELNYYKNMKVKVTRK